MNYFLILLHGNYPSFEHKPVTDEQLNEALKTLKTKKSCGYDDISSDVMKYISPLVFEQWSIFMICL